MIILPNMQTSHINHLLYSDPIVGSIFRGVYPIDVLPAISSYPSAIVVNTDKHDQPGSHWVGLYFDDKEKCEFFDSFGRAPIGHLKDYILNNSSSFTWNNTQVQQMFTTTCGQFTIFFIIWRARQVPLDAIISCLAKANSDNFVVSFINNLFRIKTKIFDSRFFRNV
jgi:hypothetical protein